MEQRLAGKICIVTGGTRGIGEAIVRLFVAEGAKVYATYNGSIERANQLVAELGDAHLHFSQLNTSSSESIKAFVDFINAETQRVDVLVNNAGMTKDNLLMRMTEEDWDLVLDTNLKSVFLLSKAFSRPMMSQRKGRIINIGSIVGSTGNAGQANYSASKAGLIGLTKSLAKEFASRNILVNCVSPGYVITDMTEKLTDEQRASFTGNIPLKRGATPDEVAKVCMFFASEDSSYVTGQNIFVDGGLAM